MPPRTDDRLEVASFRLGEPDRLRIERLARELRMTKSEVVRFALLKLDATRRGA